MYNIKNNRMKKLLVGICAFAMIATMHLSAFSQEDKKSAEARKQLAEAETALTKAGIDSAADFERFKREAADKIEDNKKKIEQLKLADDEINLNFRNEYEGEIEILEKKNNRLLMKINKAADTKTSKWSEFKKEFNKDMTNLADAIKNIGRKNITE